MIDVFICTSNDVIELAQLNQMLIEDEKAENTMSLPQLEQRMLAFLSSDYKAFLFSVEGKRVGYALVNITTTPFYLRQFFICREYHRSGYGKKSFNALLDLLQITEIDIDVYTWNHTGIAFWKSLGFFERCYNMRYKKQSQLPTENDC